MTTQQVNQLNNLFSDLKASTDFNAYSGLMAECSEDGVKVFDNYTSCIVNPSATIANLKKATPIDWNSQDNAEAAFGPIWDCIVES